MNAVWDENGRANGDANAETDAWATATEGLDLVLLDPTTCRLRHGPAGRLCGTVHGREHAEIVPYRPFPLSEPNWVSLVAVEDSDSDGRRSDGERSDWLELGVLPDLDGLDPESRVALDAALALRYFLPRVVQIMAVRDEDPSQSGAVLWDLQTDRGPMRLRMPNLFEGIQQLPSGRLLLSGGEGNRADIPDVATMDPASRRLLERYYWF